MTVGVGVPGFLDMLPFQKTKGSFVTLEQSILPGFVPPKPLDRVLKGDHTQQMFGVLIAFGFYSNGICLSCALVVVSLQC